MMSTQFPGSGDFDSPFDDFFARFFAGQQRPRRIDVTRLMTEPARLVVAEAARRAMRAGSTDLDGTHLLWALAHDRTGGVLLGRAGVEPETLVRQLDAAFGEDPASDQLPVLTPSAKRALLDAHQLSRAFGTTYIGPEHLLLALSVNPDSDAARLLALHRITPDSLQQAMFGGRTGSAGGGPMAGAGGPGGGGGTGAGFGPGSGAGAGPGGGAWPAGAGGGPGGGRFGAGSSTPTLDEFGRDLTALAREGRVDPVVGRDDEIDQTVEVLSRRTKNNPVLIGEAGVGKTAIVEGIAQRIVDGDVPDPLRGRRVVQVDLTGLVAGTRYRGDFEERLTKLMTEIREHSAEIITFLDELHTVVGAGSSEGSMGAGNMLKPALARGELHVIGATTLEEYRRHIEADPALERRFQPILVPEPTAEQAVEILRGLRDRYEAHHQVRYADEALVAAVDLSDRYLTDRFLPDKAIDLMDQAGARIRLRTKTPTVDVRGLEEELARLQREKDQAVAAEQYERASTLRDRIAEVAARVAQARGGDGQVPVVSAADIAEIVSRRTGIPVTQLTEEERDRLLRLEERLHGRVVGQEEAVAAVAEAVRRSRAGLADPDRPIGSFLFLGPTGVGKTELARALAEALFGDSDRMVRLDMSEFQERHTVSRLVGAPPGYVGYEEAGQLTEAVRRRPYSVVLLDEIEKAHPDVFNTLLQVLDDGRLTDAQGRTVDFKNTVLIMTSNLGSELIVGRRGPIGFTDGGGDGRADAGAVDGSGTDDAGMREAVMRRLREAFRPEFLNRIDEIIIFRRLDDEQLRQITELLLEETRRRLHAQGITVELRPEAVDRLARIGHERDFGARPLRRTIQREIDNRLSRMMLAGELQAGQHVVVGVRDDRFTFEVRDEQPAEPADPGAVPAGRP